jgi:plasmid maintenance system killer protein
MKTLIRIRSAKPLNEFRVLVEFTDESTREIDFEPYLHGRIFEQLRSDPKSFCSMRVDPKTGTIVWNNGADIDPDVVYQGLKPAWMESKEPEA